MLELIAVKNQYLNRKSGGYLNLKLGSTSKKHEITNHKLQNRFFCLDYMHYFISYFCTKKKDILHKHSQNKHLLIYTFLFFSFYFHKICRFCFPKNKNADNICKVI